MISIYVDFNDRVTLDRIRVAINFKWNAGISQEKLLPGLRVKLYSEDLECEGILQQDECGIWVADLIKGTFKDIPEDQWDRLTRSESRSGKTE